MYELAHVTLAVFLCACMCVVTCTFFKAPKVICAVIIFQTVWSTNSCTSTLISCHSRWKFKLYTTHTHKPSFLHTHTDILKLIIFKLANVFGVGGEKVRDQPVFVTGHWWCLWLLGNVFPKIQMNCHMSLQGAVPSRISILRFKTSDMPLKFKWPPPQYFSILPHEYEWNHSLHLIIP